MVPVAMMVGIISVVMPMIGRIVAIMMMVVAMMVVAAVPSCGWNHAAGCDCADHA